MCYSQTSHSPWSVPLHIPYFQVQNSAPLPAAPPLHVQDQRKMGEKQRRAVGPSLERLNFTPSPQIRKEQSAMKGNAATVGLARSALGLCPFPCRVHTRELCPAAWGQQLRGSSLAKPHLRVSAPSACATNHKSSRDTARQCSEHQQPPECCKV